MTISTHSNKSNIGSTKEILTFKNAISCPLALKHEFHAFRVCSSFCLADPILSRTLPPPAPWPSHCLWAEDNPQVEIPPLCLWSLFSSSFLSILIRFSPFLNYCCSFTVPTTLTQDSVPCPSASVSSFHENRDLFISIFRNLFASLPWEL